MEQKHFGPYRLLSPLGEGGMGTVFLAYHEERNEKVALKTLKQPKESLLRSLRREIHTLAQLSHPGIVKIFDEGVHEGLPYYAMELLEGQNLRQWRDALVGEESASSAKTVAEEEWVALQEESLPTIRAAQVSSLSPIVLQKLLTMFAKICAPLAFLHSEGLLHRDLKPENIIVRADGTPVLVDFGLALHFSRRRDSRESLQFEHGISGTSYYMSPEQIQGDSPDARADIYALGVIFFEMLTGHRPFVADKPLAVMRKHLLSAPPLPSSLVSGLPKALEDLLLQLLSKSRGDRPGYAEDVARALIELGAEADLSQASLRPYLYRASLAGREEALASLRALATRIEQNGGGLALIGGESGVGKTRLVSELSREVARRGGAVLAGECVERQGRHPLEPFRRPLQEIKDRCVEQGPEETKRLFGDRVKLLAPYRGSLLTLPGVSDAPEPAELPLEAAKRRLFAALGETLFAFSQERPLLLVLDDLQWADSLSLEFLQTLLIDGPLRRWLLVVGTYRTDEINEGLISLLSSERVEKLSLSRLEESAVSRMVSEMLALRAPSPEFCLALTQHSEGNPFFVAEYLHTAVEEGLLHRDKAGRWQLEEPLQEERSYERLPLPKTLRALVERRFDGLPSEASELVERQSVLGREAPLSLLEAMGPVSTRALHELTRRQILIEASPGVIGFAHDKLREVSYQRLTQERRNVLHRAAALAFEAVYTGERRQEHAAVLGYHWEQTHEPARARSYYLSAARRTAQAYSHQQAEALYRAYLSLVDEPNEESLRVHNELGEKVLYTQGRMKEALVEHQSAFEGAKEKHLTKLEAESLRLLGIVHWRLGEHEEAQGAYQRALFLAQSLSELSLQSLCWRNLASLRHEQGKLAEARILYDQALSLHRQVGDRTEEGRCIANLAVLCHDQGKLDEARALYEEALFRCRETLNRRLEAICQNNLAGLHHDQGRTIEAILCYEEALSLARVVGDRRFEGLCLSNIAALRQEQGQLTEARGYFEKALLLLREGGDKSEEGRCLWGLAEQERWEKGDLTRAEELCKEAAPKLAKLPEKLGRLCCIQGHLALAKGESAEPWIRTAAQLAREIKASAGQDLQRRLTWLRNAQEASERGERLFRGQRVEDIPPLLRRWLLQHGQLSLS